MQTMKTLRKFKNLSILSFCLIAFFSPWLIGCANKMVSFPYDVKTSLTLQGWDLVGDDRVRCVLLQGDQLHHVGASDIRVDRSITAYLLYPLMFDDLHRYSVALEDPYSSGCALDSSTILLLDSDVSGAIKRDKARSKKYSSSKP